MDTLVSGAGPSPGCLVDLTMNMWVYWCVRLIPWSGSHFGRVLLLAESCHQMDRASCPGQEPLGGTTASQESCLVGTGWVKWVVSQWNAGCPVLANLMESGRNGTCQCWMS